MRGRAHAQAHADGQAHAIAYADARAHAHAYAHANAGISSFLGSLVPQPTFNRIC